MLFMKGTPDEPRCGFSARVGGNARTRWASSTRAMDILPDPRIREELSALSNWPTIPQLFVGSELVGGCRHRDRDVRVGRAGRQARRAAARERRGAARDAAAGAAPDRPQLESPGFPPSREIRELPRLRPKRRRMRTCMWSSWYDSRCTMRRGPLQAACASPRTRTAPRRPRSGRPGPEPAGGRSGGPCGCRARAGPGAGSGRRRRGRSGARRGRGRRSGDRTHRPRGRLRSATPTRTAPG